MTTKKFTPTIKRGPRLTPGEINVTPPDDLGIEIPPSGMQKAMPWVMGTLRANGRLWEVDVARGAFGITVRTEQVPELGILWTR